MGIGIGIVAAAVTTYAVIHFSQTDRSSGENPQSTTTPPEDNVLVYLPGLLKEVSNNTIIVDQTFGHPDYNSTSSELKLRRDSGTVFYSCSGEEAKTCGSLYGDAINNQALTGTHLCAVGLIKEGVLYGRSIFLNAACTWQKPPVTKPIQIGNDTNPIVSLGFSGLEMNICGDLENGSQNTPGTDVNPAVIHRGGSIVIPLCMRSVDPVGKTYDLEARDATLMGEPPTHGIHVTFDKTRFTLAAQPQKAEEPGTFPPILEHINMTINADSNATQGVYYFWATASYPLGPGKSHLTGITIYVNIQ
jgi:hypothetical protein